MDEKVCGAKMSADWVPAHQSLFCNAFAGHSGVHSYTTIYQPPKAWADVGLYTRAFKLAQQNNQLIGEKNDLYVTLEQLQELMRA